MSGPEPSVRADLLAAIRADPDADAPRLVYADWCDEHGEPDRANFIRVQLERTHLPPWDVRQIGLRNQEEALLTANGSAWRAEQPSVPGIEWGPFKRGFVAHATIESFSRLVEVRDAMADVTGLAHLEVPWPASEKEAQAVRPMPGLRGLQIKRAIRTAEEPGWLADAPLLGTLHHLALIDAFSLTPSTERLLSSPHLGGLRSLRLERSETGREGVPALIEDGRFPHLIHLALSELGDERFSWSDWHGGLLEEPLAQLASWPGLAQIEVLDLAGNRIEGNGLAILLSSPHFVGVRQLDLSETLAGRYGEVPWDDAHDDLRLHALNLGNGNVMDEVDWLQAPCLSELRLLSLGEAAAIEDEAFVHLLGAPFARTLEVLRLTGAEVEGSVDRFFSALASSELPALHTLDVGDVWDAAEAHVAQLVGSKMAESLRALVLTGVDIQTLGARALAESARLSGLERLTLGADMPAAIRRTIETSALGRRLRAKGGLHYAEGS